MGAVAIGSLAFAGAILLSGDSTTRLVQASEACELSGAVADDGHTLSLVRVAAEENPGSTTLTDYECVLAELEVPRAVRDHMGGTRALDGMQTDEWDGLQARWTYHPTNGVNMTITDG